MTGPVTNWNITTINGNQYLVIDTANFRIPLDWDPSSNMFIAVAAPNGGLGNFPALLQGQPGQPAFFSTTVEFTALEANDPTPDSASLLAIGSNVYQLVLALHKGQDGSPTTAVLNPTAYGTPIFKQILRVNAATTGFEYTSQLVGDRYIPASILSCPSGNPSFTLCAVQIPAQTFDYRPQCSGYCVFTGTGTDVQVDLVARLGANVGGSLTGETSGSVVARGTQPAGITPATHTLSAAIPPGSADSYDRVYAGTSAVLYMRAEQQSGTASFITSNSTTLFAVRLQGIP